MSRLWLAFGGSVDKTAKFKTSISGLETGIGWRESMVVITGLAISRYHENGYAY